MAKGSPTPWASRLVVIESELCPRERRRLARIFSRIHALDFAGEAPAFPGKRPPYQTDAHPACPLTIFDIDNDPNRLYLIEL